MRAMIGLIISPIGRASLLRCGAGTGIFVFIGAVLLRWQGRKPRFMASGVSSSPLDAIIISKNCHDASTSMRNVEVLAVSIIGCNTVKFRSLTPIASAMPSK